MFTIFQRFPKHHINKIEHELAAWFNLSEGELKSTYPDGRNQWKIFVETARKLLVEAGLLGETQRGVWDLTDKGKQLAEKLLIDLNIDEDVKKDLEALIQEECFEGGHKIKFTNYYERKPKLRTMAIRYHGFKCIICNFDFHEAYGERGKNYIEGHHTKPVSKLVESTFVDPIKDMVVVCSNCHRLIFQRKNISFSHSIYRHFSPQISFCVAQGTLYRRVKIKRGCAKAIVAVAKELLTIAYHLIKKQELYNPYHLLQQNQAIS